MVFSLRSGRYAGLLLLTRPQVAASKIVNRVDLPIGDPMNDEGSDYWVGGA